MAAGDNAVTILGDLVAIMKDDYLPGLQENWMYFGSITNRIFSPSRRKSKADVFEIKVESEVSRSVRSTKDINGVFATPQANNYDTYQLTFSETEADNDFARTTGSIETSHYDLKQVVNSADRPGAMVDTVDRWVNQLTKSFSEHKAIHRHIDADCRLATVQGAVKDNDSSKYDSASAYSSGTDGRVQLTNGSISYFGQGMKVNVRSSAGADRGDYTVTDVNVADISNDSVGSIGLEQNSGTIGNIADTDEIYLTNEYDASIEQGRNGFGEWFNTDNTLYGKNRATPANRWMNPHVIEVGTSSAPAQIQRDHFDRMGDIVAHVTEMGVTPVVFAAPRIHTSLRQQIGEDALHMIDPSRNQREKRVSKFGFSGLVYQHPSLGVVTIQADPLCVSDRVRFVVMEDWEEVMPFGAEDSVEFMPGEIAGMWYRMEYNDGVNDGRGTFYKTDAHMLSNDICTFPRRQIDLRYVKP